MQKESRPRDQVFPNISALFYFTEKGLWNSALIQAVFKKCNIWVWVGVEGLPIPHGCLAHQTWAGRCLNSAYCLLGLHEGAHEKLLIKSWLF